MHTHTHPTHTRNRFTYVKSEAPCMYATRKFKLNIILWCKCKYHLMMIFTFTTIFLSLCSIIIYFQWGHFLITISILYELVRNIKATSYKVRNTSTNTFHWQVIPLVCTRRWARYRSLTHFIQWAVHSFPKSNRA